jgi:serine/threonine-protein kinase
MATVADENYEWRVGTIVRDKWTLVRLLGVGGMAAVYVGVHKIGRHDALKILHPAAAQSREVRLRFEREAQAVNRFRHPGAVEIRDIDVTEDGAPFLVMELLFGESLAQRMQRARKMPVGEALGHVERVLDVLAAAHEQGIIHRDIKPANIFLTREGTLKVLDFGLARIQESGSVDGLFTKEGTTLGTTPYMPPEQALGHASVDERADVFSVGATLFRLLTGRYVHKSASSFDLLVKMGREPAPPIQTIAPELPDHICAVVDRALAFDREARYPNARSMLEDVRSVARGEVPRNAGLGPPLDEPPPDPGPEPPTRVPVASEEIPIYLSGFTELGDGPATVNDRAPAEPRQAASGSPGLERTLVSPGNEPPGRR